MAFFNSTGISGSLKIETFGGNGDPDVFVKFQSKPNKTHHDVKSANSGSREMITIHQVQTGNITYPCRWLHHTFFSCNLVP